MEISPLDGGGDGILDLKHCAYCCSPFHSHPVCVSQPQVLVTAGCQFQCLHEQNSLDNWRGI
jgi:hypothetical protein